jgi:hypothetical protein
MEIEQQVSLHGRKLVEPMGGCHVDLARDAEPARGALEDRDWSEKSSHRSPSSGDRGVGLVKQ